MAWPPVLPPNNRTDQTLSRTNHPGDHNTAANALGDLVAHATQADARLTTLEAADPETYIDAAGDLMTGDAAGAPTRLARGATGQSLRVRSDGLLEWYTPSTVGTIVTTAGDLITGNAAGAPVRLPRGVAGQSLRVRADGLLEWYTPTTAPTIITTPGDLIVGNAAGTAVRQARGTTGQALRVRADGLLEWQDATITRHGIDRYSNANQDTGAQSSWWVSVPTIGFDTDGYQSGDANSVVPAGLGGLYVITFTALISLIAGTTQDSAIGIGILVNDSWGVGFQFTYHFGGQPVYLTTTTVVLMQPGHWAQPIIANRNTTGGSVMRSYATSGSNTTAHAPHFTMIRLCP